MGRSRNERKVRGTFGIGRGTQLRWDLLDSVAYNVLTPMQAQILNDMLRTYYRASNWDTAGVPGGFTYTYSQCRVFASEKTFYRAIRRICLVGFFRCPPEIQENRPAAPYRFVESADWMKYEPTVDEQSVLRKFKADKNRRLAQKKRRRTDFRVGLGQSEREKGTPTSDGKNDADK